MYVGGSTGTDAAAEATAAAPRAESRWEIRSAAPAAGALRPKAAAAAEGNQASSRAATAQRCLEARYNNPTENIDHECD